MNLADATRTTTFRWSIAIALALLLQSAGLCGLFYWWTARHSRTEVDTALQSDCRLFQTLGRDALIGAIDKKVRDDVHRVNLAGLFGPGGEVLAGNIAMLPPELAAEGGPVVVGLVRSDPPDPTPNSSRAVACASADGERLVFAHDMDELDYIHALIKRALVDITAPAILVAAALGLVLSIRAQRRFLLVHGAVEEVMGGNLGRRLPVRSTMDPFGRLAQAVNLMLDRLEEAIADVRGLGDDIAHELRTPLTRLRARLERGCRDAETSSEFQEVGERAIRDIDQALLIVSAILRIRAIEETKRTSEFARVDARVLLKDAADLYMPTAEDRRIGIDVEAGPPAYVVADRDLLMEAICNLIDNAIKFTPLGGTVRCSLTALGESVETIRVADNGPGIAHKDRDAVLRRFHRGADQPAIDGHGIGLSLVAAIVRLHRFSLRIDDAHPGCEMIIACGQAREQALGDAIVMACCQSDGPHASRSMSSGASATP